VTWARRAWSRWPPRLFAAGPLQTGKLSIARVRFAFGSLLCMLLCGVLLLLSAALDRLEQERVMRHEVVAARVFDELERELNAHLERESARPSSVYDAPTSQVAAWAPYVVGYFTVANDYRVLSNARLPAPRSARIQAALARVWPDPRHSFPAVASSSDEDYRSANTLDESIAKDLVVQKQRSAAAGADKKLAPKLKTSKAFDNSPEVLRRLNRAQEVRQSQLPAQSKEDPFAY
jgi:hypothetical protein